MPTKNNPAKSLLFFSLGMVISIIPVGVAIFSYFPLWIAREDTSILSGLTLLLLSMSLLPLYRHLKRTLHSPSAPLIWFISFAAFLLLSRIADEMTVISFVGFTTNLIGALFFKLARKYGTAGDENEGRT